MDLQLPPMSVPPAVCISTSPLAVKTSDSNVDGFTGLAAEKATVVASNKSTTDILFRLDF